MNVKLEGETGGFVKTAGGGRLLKTVPLQYSLSEGIDVGMDSGSTVDFAYKLPFRFPMKLKRSRSN